MSQNRPNIFILSEVSSQIIIDEFNKLNSTINFYDYNNEVEFKNYLSEFKNNKIDLIILNLNQLTSASKEVLKYIKTNSETRYIPVVVLSSDTEKDNIEYAYNNFVNSYILKNDKNLSDISNVMAEFWLSTVILPSQH